MMFTLILVLWLLPTNEHPDKETLYCWNAALAPHGVTADGLCGEIDYPETRFEAACMKIVASACDTVYR